MNTTIKPPISYTGVILDTKSHQKLIKKFKKFIPDDWELKAHHMTIHMGPVKEGDYVDKHKGMNIYLSVDSFAMDDKVCAVGVSGFVSKNKQPHVTIAVNRKKGGKPYHSNELKDWKEIKRPFKIMGKIKEITY